MSCVLPTLNKGDDDDDDDDDMILLSSSRFRIGCPRMPILRLNLKLKI